MLVKKYLYSHWEMLAEAGANETTSVGVRD